MSIYLISKRNITASPHYTHIYELENIILDTCEAQLITPAVHHFIKYIHDNVLREPLKNKVIQKPISKTIGIYENIIDIPNLSLDRENILFLIGMNGADLNLLSSIRGWREKFDLVVAFIYDAWLFKSYPRLTEQIDQLFVPIRELVEPLQSRFSIPVAYWPHASNVLQYGSKNLNRSIDVASYGRVPSKYHNRLTDICGQSGNDFFYYRQVPEKGQLYPNEPYNLRRSDAQHRVLLNKILAHSKLSLAFDFTYTTNHEVELQRAHKHPSFSYKKPVIALRWFEGIAAGTAIVGKRPPTSEMDTLFNWEDATIELPDEVEDGVGVIMDLIEDSERLSAIHQRNYWNALSRHDHRWRIESAFEHLGLPIPAKLQMELQKIQTLQLKHSQLV